MTMDNCAAAKVTRASCPVPISIIFAVVLATAEPVRKTPAKLNIAAKITAALGLNTLVETTVAIAFGASVHPLTKTEAQTKSNTMAKANIDFPFQYQFEEFIKLLISNSLIYN